MECLECGNCKGTELAYYCTARNEFMIKEETPVIEKERKKEVWKKGGSCYESRRRACRSEKDSGKKTG